MLANKKQVTKLKTSSKKQTMDILRQNDDIL